MLYLVPVLAQIPASFSQDCVLPCIEALLSAETYREAVEITQDLQAETCPRSAFRSDVDWFLCVVAPESRDLCEAYYREDEDAAPLSEWFAASELQQIDTMLCEALVAAQEAC